MSYSYVYCSDCETDDGSLKRWRWLCPDCADDFAARHRTEYRHLAVEVAVITDDDYIPKAINVMMRNGW